MTGSPSWLASARCRQLGIPVADFVPPEGATPSAHALAACNACPVAAPVAAPCAADRGKDVGLRGDGFVGGRNGERVRPCEDCGVLWVPPLTAAVAMAVLRGERTVRGVAGAVGVAPMTAHHHLLAARQFGLVGWEPESRGTLHTRLRVVGGAQ